MRPTAGILSVSLVVTLAACGGTVPKSGDKPAKVEPVAHESELMKITLSAEAERRLGIAVAPAVTDTRAGTLATFGEIVVPPPSSGGIPLSAATDLAALAANQGSSRRCSMAAWSAGTAKTANPLLQRHFDMRPTWPTTSLRWFNRRIAIIE